MRTLPRLLALPLLLAAIAAAGPALAQADEGGDTILPGLWSYKTSALTLYNKTERRCIRPNEIEKVMSGAVNHHYTCSYPARSQSYGRVSMRGVCTDKKGRRIPISMSGTFTPTTLDMQVQVAGIIPVSVRGRRLSPSCAGGEEG